METSDLEQKAKKLRSFIWAVDQKLRQVQNGYCRDNLNLTIQELRAIDYLGQFGPDMTKNLADYLLLALSSTTALVDKLEDKGIVRRQRSTEDRRVIQVGLTEAGRETFTQAARAYLNFCKGMLKRLDEDDQDDLIELFRKISQAP
jgi:DNA-binding MarR family transcriptional regulator